jgi:hypothetical protein
LLEIFNSCKDDKKNYIPKIRVIYEKINKLKEINNNFKKANDLIFHTDKTKKELEREINKMRLPKLMHDQLIWKSKQMSKYK